MRCQDRVIAVDDMESKRQQFEARPYFFAHPEFKKLPIFGEFRGYDNPELILALEPAPDLIFKTYPEMGFDPSKLQEKTGIPVFCLEYGDLGSNRQAFYNTLRVIGTIMKKGERAEEIIRYCDGIIADLNRRTENIEKRKTCYIGGIAYRGPLGIQSTEPGYPPFIFINTLNAALDDETMTLAHIDVSKEKIVEWDPEIIFIDCATFQSDPQANALYELSTDPAFSALRAVTSGTIYSVLPYNWYTENHGSTFANAYYIGTILYPKQFADIDPEKKTDEIYTFLAGEPVFQQMSESFNNMVFKRLEL
jgi:iron complex transport system substrate-binding protein